MITARVWERKTFTRCWHLQVCLGYKWGISYQRPEDVDGEEGDGEGDQTHSLQSALQLQVVLGSPQAQPAGDGCQRCDEEKTGHVAQQGALLTPRARVLQPLNIDKQRITKWRMCWLFSIYRVPVLIVLFLFILTSHLICPHIFGLGSSQIWIKGHFSPF